jgi:hypothetical protein
MLQQCDLNQITSSTTIEQIDEDIVCYANLLIEIQTGKILYLTPCNKVLWQENAVSTPVVIKSKGIFENPSLLELVRMEDLSDLSPSSVNIVEASLEAFNKVLESNKKNG